MLHRRLPPPHRRQAHHEANDRRGLHRRVPVRDTGMRVAGSQLAESAGHRGQRRRFLHHPGAVARCGYHPAEHPGPGRRRQRRQRHQDRGTGLACAGDHADQRRRPSARQRHRQGRADQPAGVAAHRTGAAHRRAAGGRTQRRFADPAVVRRAPIRPPSRRWRSVSVLLNGGGLGQIQEINQAFANGASPVARTTCAA